MTSSTIVENQPHNPTDQSGVASETSSSPNKAWSMSAEIKKAWRNTKRRSMAWVRQNQRICLAATVVISIGLASLVALLWTAFNPSHLASQSAQAVTIRGVTTTSTLAENPIQGKLDDISNHLATLHQQLAKQSAYVNVDQLRAALANLHEQVSALAKNSNALIAQQIQKSTAKLQVQLQTITAQLHSLTATQSHKIAASHLPFQILSIDTIQQAAVVTVRYANRVMPMDIGDSLAGWTLTTASNTSQTAQFTNAKKDYVVIDQQQLAAE